MTRPLTINWLIPEPFPGAGGDTGIFRAIRHLAEFGHECHVYVVSYNLMNDYSTAQIRDYIREHFGPSAAHYYRWEGSVGEADCTFATFWPTVENLLTLPNGGRRYYLVQDFEPSFYPDHPEHYARAENTYRAGLHCITLGPWLAKLLRERYHATAEHFDFAVDTKIYWPRPVAHDPRRRLCFYARPATPRRAYGLGLAALQSVKARLPEVEIVFFGTSDLDPRPAFPFVDRGMLTPEELATLFSSSDIGVVFSLTNPSFIPLEMMACRCAVVEIASERWEGVLNHGQDAWLVEPAPEAIADGIVHLLDDATLRARLVENAYERVRTMDWRQSARQIEAVLLREAAAETLALPSRRFAPRVYGVGAWTNHLHFAYDLVALFKPHVLVELGTDRGESYFAFCQSVAENETGTRSFAVDTWQGDEHAGGYDETTFAEVSAHNHAHYQKFSTLMRCTFDDALNHFPDESIDVLHLDGLHTEAAVRHDIDRWLPKIRGGGLLLMHDVNVQSRDFGVWKVWADLRAGGRSWMFTEGPGLGVWQNSRSGGFPTAAGRFAKRPSLLETLFAGPEKERNLLLEYYRARAQELHEKIARHWCDGTIRAAPWAQQTVIQVFYTTDGTHCEEGSVNARIGHGDWKEVSIALPPEAGAAPLRIDFVSPLTVIDLAAIRLSAAAKVYFDAPKATSFDAISAAGDLERLPHPRFLRLKITGIDPQLYLPPLDLPGGEGPLRLEMRLRVSVDDPPPN